VILGGGLDPENVGGALADLGDLLPWGVDVASGVEGAGIARTPTRSRASSRRCARPRRRSPETEKAK
jgi:phosphoribosylanthranilate isomerase